MKKIHDTWRMDFSLMAPEATALGGPILLKSAPCLKSYKSLSKFEVV